MSMTFVRIRMPQDVLVPCPCEACGTSFTFVDLGVVARTSRSVRLLDIMHLSFVSLQLFAGYGSIHIAAVGVVAVSSLSAKNVEFTAKAVFGAGATPASFSSE